MSDQTTTDTTETTFFHPDLFVVPTNGEKPYLLAYKCEDEKCGKVWFPRLDTCPDCWSNTKQIKLSRTGKLYGYSVIYVGPKEIKLPYVIGYVDLPENLRIFAQIQVAIDKVKVGMDVEVMAGQIRVDDSGPVISYMFKAAE